MNDNETTTFLEIDWPHWVCRKCGGDWVFLYALPSEDNYNYCPGCGRRIVEFVAAKEANDD